MLIQGCFQGFQASNDKQKQQEEEGARTNDTYATVLQNTVLQVKKV
jgi:hypothetical protein